LPIAAAIYYGVLRCKPYISSTTSCIVCIDGKLLFTTERRLTFSVVGNLIAVGYMSGQSARSPELFLVGEAAPGPTPTPRRTKARENRNYPKQIATRPGLGHARASPKAPRVAGAAHQAAEGRAPGHR
jgi:hypothetical protein